MTTITLPRATVEQALEALEGSAGILQHEHVWPGAEKKSRFVIAALRAALAQQDEPTLTIERLRDALVASRIIPPSAVEAMWFADEITALRAALAQQDEPVEPGYWGRVAARQASRIKQLETAAQQALEALDAGVPISPKSILHDWFRAALAQQDEPVEPVESVEPVKPVVWDVTKNGRLIYDYDFTHDVSLRVMGDFEDDEQRVRYAKQIVDKLNAALAQQAEPDHETRAELAEQQVVQLAEERDHYRNLWQKAQQAEPMEPVAHFGSAYVNENGVHITTVLGPVAIPQDAKLYTAPPQRTMVPLTEEEILAAVGWERAAMYMKLTPNFPVDEAKKETLTNARAVEKAVWEKNHG